MDAAASTSTLQNKRFSRYRSVRRGAANGEEQQPPVPDVPNLPEAVPPIPGQQVQCAVSRAPSRYHRKPATQRIENAPVPGQPSTVRSCAKPVASRPQPIPEVQDGQDDTFSKSSPGRGRAVDVYTSSQTVEYPRQPTGTPANGLKMTRYRSKTTPNPKIRPASPRGSYEAARQEARAILEGEYDRLSIRKQQEEKANKERRRQAEAKAAASRVEQVKREKAKETAVYEIESSQLPPQQRQRKWTIGGNSQKSSPATAPSSPPPSQGTQPIQHSLSRKVSQAVRRQPEDAVVPKAPVSAAPFTGFVDQPVRKKVERRPTESRPGAASTNRAHELRAGDGPPKTAITAPRTVDAPISAVNAGERRVEVRFGKSKITLPVTPSTTARELLNSASIILSEPIDPRTSVLIETYSPLGLERPLRRYERIRDVMNSWDSDTQNHLMILPESECDAKGLEQKDAPEAQPSHVMLNLYHSQRPGKWERHWMILKEDGQVTASKIENDGNATNVFHLSDFDVYMPRRREMKKLRPPKKICFAIKSQQRSIMFESTENFVHFFSTSDKAVADEWYNAVQAWRSWYLVKILDQGGASKAPITSAAPVGSVAPQRRPSTARSRDSVPYQLGTFQPLLEFSIDAFKYGDDGPSEPEPAEALKPTSPDRPKALVDRARNNANPEAISVLQRTGTTKRTAPPVSKQPRGLVEESKNEVKDGWGGPSLVSTDEGFTGKGLLARAFSVKKPQAEDHAAVYENTDNAFTGKGLLARTMSTKKYVNENLVVPENTNDAFTGSGLLARKMSTKKFVNENVVVLENTNDAFTGSGLLSRSVTRKRSQATRPGQPLVDLSLPSEFKDRSLLRNVEEYEISQGQHLPVIDRSKTTEVNSKTGEV